MELFSMNEGIKKKKIPLIECDPYDAFYRRRKHGFQKPLCFRQFLTWILFSLDIILYCLSTPFSFQKIVMIIIFSVC